jgi:RES domain-containing protein
VPATAWAEWAAATRGAIDPRDERRRLWRIDVSALPVVDLRRPEVQDALAVDLDGLVGPRADAQPLAARARALGAAGMVVPSAAHPGHWTLVVFPEGFGALRVTGSRADHPRPPTIRRRISSS